MINNNNDTAKAIVNRIKINIRLTIILISELVLDNIYSWMAYHRHSPQASCLWVLLIFDLFWLLTFLFCCNNNDNKVRKNLICEQQSLSMFVCLLRTVALKCYK